MNIHIMDKDTRLDIKDNINSIFDYLDTIEMLDTEISTYLDDEKMRNCCILARDAVFEQTKNKLQQFRNYINYAVKDIEPMITEE